ncbi:MAG: hypothetical protein JRG73_05205 [Deltaproteobacteria bacterium]|nr:hypothetical protein [Deltaproteobacteria bacterium]MBW2306316.1 hypothetical protein [Deltaproteobacteria bacterium]
MFIPAHVGLTLGAIVSLKWLFPHRFARWSVTFWPLCLAALLPDIVDKFLALIVLKGYHTSRLFAHTLLFSGLAILFAYLWRRDWIPYAWIMLGHHYLDSNWSHPTTMFFPLLGFQFDRGLPTHDSIGYFYALWLKYVYGPEWFVPEVIGTAVLVVYFYGRTRFHHILDGPLEGKSGRQAEK